MADIPGHGEPLGFGDQIPAALPAGLDRRRVRNHGHGRSIRGNDRAVFVRAAEELPDFERGHDQSAGELCFWNGDEFIFHGAGVNWNYENGFPRKIGRWVASAIFATME